MFYLNLASKWIKNGQQVQKLLERKMRAADKDVS